MPSVSSFPASQPTSPSQLQAQKVTSCSSYTGIQSVLREQNPGLLTPKLSGIISLVLLWPPPSWCFPGEPLGRQGRDFPAFNLYCGMCVPSGIWLNETSWTIAPQGPLSMAFPRQEHWSGVPIPPPGDLPNPGLKPVSLASSALQVDFYH